MSSLKADSLAGSNAPLRQSQPLYKEDLIHIFDQAEWNDVSEALEPITQYNGYPALGLIKVCTLPFVINVPSERSLGRILKDSIFLQQLCDVASTNLGVETTPSRATLWHFKTKYAEKFQWWLLRSLVTVAISGRGCGITIPFEASPPLKGNFTKDTFQSKSHKAQISIHAQAVRVPACNRRIPGQRELFEEPQYRGSTSVRRQREGSRIAEQVGMPAEVLVEFDDGRPRMHFGLIEPSWHYQNILDFDREIPMFENEIHSYAACNILVVREREGSEQILMARRLGDGFGHGKLAAPGGKKRKEETIIECARRELHEEANLSFDNAEIISYMETNFPGKPTVASIGLVVRERDTSGYIRQRESSFGEWSWYSLYNLPDEIFEPTRIVLKDYLNGEPANLTFEQVEEKVRNIELAPLPLWRDPT